MTIEELLISEFGFSNVSLKVLDGYSNANYLVNTKKDSFIFKSYDDLNAKEVIEAESQLLLYLKKKGQAGVPKPIVFSNGVFSKNVELDGETKICRLLTFVEGTFLGNAALNDSLVSSLGSYMAHLNSALVDFDHVAFRAKKSNWDLQFALRNKKFIEDIPSAKKRNWVSYFFQQYEQQVPAIVPELRTTCIHGDFNEWNILLDGNKVNGIIDFGDAAHTQLINELAVAATYIFYLSENPLEFAEPLLKSYHAILPLEEKEIDILYWLIAMRLCTSVCNSAHARLSTPENDYASVSEEKAWALIEKWLRIGPRKIENHFRTILGFPVKSTTSIKNALEKRNEHLSKILSVSYQKPILMERAAFQYMFDGEGNSFLDAYNNIPHVGHQHPKVVEAGQRQMAKLNTNTRYLYDVLPQYAERLLAKFPNKLNKVFFVNSGSAASDLAIRLAKAHTGHENILVMEHGYHGNTQIGIDISDYKFNHPKGQGQASHILKAVIPDTYRGEFTQNDKSAGRAYAQKEIKKLENRSVPLAAFITEPIVGCGGQIPLAQSYLTPMYEAIRAQGGVCISDETQTGFGRLGDVFWGFEQQDVVPDIVILGKPMGNGHPIGAVVTTDKIVQSFENGVEFFSSFGGNPVSCTIGLAVLDVLKEERLQENAHEVGNYFIRLMSELQHEFPCIGDVRGSGLFIGIDMVKPGTKEPDTQLAQHIKNALRERHILVSTDGPYNNVIKSKPPLCFTGENVEEVVANIQEILADKYH